MYLYKYGGESLGKGERLINRYKLDFRLIRDIDRTLLVTMITIIIYGILNIYIATKGGASEAGAFYFSPIHLKQSSISSVVLKC